MNNMLFWVATAAYALHILEEFFYDWKNWAQRTLQLPVDWDGFYVCNAAVLVLGAICAVIGWECRVLALAYPGLMLINALFFHILPVIRTQRFSLGLITACLFFLPVVYQAFQEAAARGVSLTTMLLSTGLGALIMAYPILLIKTKDRPFFDQKH